MEQDTSQAKPDLTKLNEYFNDNEVTKVLLSEQAEFRYGDLLTLTVHLPDGEKVFETRAFEKNFKFVVKKKVLDASYKISIKVDGRKILDDENKQYSPILEINTPDLTKSNNFKGILTLKAKKAIYIDDIENYALEGKVTSLIVCSKRQTPSAYMTKEFLNVLEHTLTKRNFSGYSPGYKDEFRSKASILFVKHWHKFDPSRARLNYFQKNGELFYKEVSELRGAFGWYSLFSKTGIVDEIKRLKKIRVKNAEIVDQKNAELAGYDSCMYQN